MVLITVLTFLGRIPFGYAYDVKTGCQDYGLDMPDENAEKSNYMQILANIIDYLRQSKEGPKTLPPLYTMPEKVAPVQDFIVQMCKKAGEFLDFVSYLMVDPRW